MQTLPSPLLIIDKVEMDWRLFLLPRQVRSFNLRPKREKKKRGEREKEGAKSWMMEKIELAGQRVRLAPPAVGKVWGEQQLLSKIIFCTLGEEKGTPPSSTFLHPATSTRSRRRMKGFVGLGRGVGSPCALRRLTFFGVKHRAIVFQNCLPAVTGNAQIN